MMICSLSRQRLLCALIALALTNVRGLAAQDADPRPPDTKKDSTPQYPNSTAGELTPGRGFDLVKTDFGSLNISFYGLFRYVDQTPGSQTFTDHLGRTRDVKPRNDLNWHRTMFWLSGFFYQPNFRYNITGWSLPTTQQTLIFGNLQYTVAQQLTIGVGIAPSLTARSLQGSWPYWAASDRQMAEEFFRGGFSSGVWITGEVLPRLNYTLSVTNNISQLGVTQGNDTRDMFYSGSLRVQPTTGEFGPRNGFGDFEHHRKLATQFGISSGTGRESRGASNDQSPNATQIKISDGINVFETGALANDVTVQKLTYSEVALDAGAKYRGFSFQGEYYWRKLSDFVADGRLPLSAINDNGLFGEAGYMALPKKLNVYATGSYIFDQFRNFPWEAGGGANFYPSGTRSWRLNAHMLHVHKSAASSLFSYYQGGQTGQIFSLGVDILI